MSDLDKELQDADGIDTNFNELDNLVEFVDMEDLGSLVELGDFAELGDLDLQNIPTLEGMEEEQMVSNEAEATSAGSDTPFADGEESRTVEPQEPPLSDSDVNVMLDNLLDNLDMTGSLEEPEEEKSSKEEVQNSTTDQSEDGIDGGMDDLLDLLGGTETEEDSSGEESEAAGIFALDHEEKPDDSEEDILSLMEEPIMDSLMPEEPPEKKPGLIKRLFANVVTDEIAEEELSRREAEKEEAALQEIEGAKRKEEEKAAKAEKAEEKAVKKAAKAEEKALIKAAKVEEKAAKKVQKEAEESEVELEITGKLNKAGVSIIIILAVLFLVTEILGTQVFSYRSTLREANGYFESKKYTQAYREIMGTDVKEEDKELYDKVITVMKVQRSINSYTNYSNMKYYSEALHALFIGIKRYDENIEAARGLEVDDDLDVCLNEILTALENDFGLSEAEAYDILALEKEEYTRKVVDLGVSRN